MDALQVLKREHNVVRRLFAQLRRTSSRAHRQRAELLERIALELDVHGRIEHEIFYPAVETLPEARHAIAEARADHQAIRDVFVEFGGVPSTDPAFATGLDELREVALAHLAEEEDDVFPLALRLGPDRLQQLGAEIEGRRRELDEERSAA